MEIVCLIPCLLQDHNREKILENIQSNIEKLSIDKYVILAQCFKDSEFEIFKNKDNVELIGNYDYARGFVDCKNDLFHYFYKSNYDYALLLDANCTVSKTTLNSHLTLLNAIRNYEIEPDLVTVSIGVLPDTDRAELNKSNDYFEYLTLLDANQKKYQRNQNEMYFTYLKNISKFYNKEIFIPNECDCHIGLFEDVYFISLMKRCFDCWYAPSIIASKIGGTKLSTWQNNKNDKYDYPKIDWANLNKIIENGEYNLKRHYIPSSLDHIKIRRVDEYKEYLKEFKPRKLNKTKKFELF